ncbi:MAG: HlyD family secretion protein [Pseudomonadota bacterium]
MSLKRWMIVGVTLLIVTLLYSLSGYIFVYNNNAYVSADVVRIAAGVSGIVSKVPVEDNSFVKEGSLLLSLDQVPFQLNVQSARARLSKALAEQRNLSLETAEKRSELEIQKAQNQLAAENLARYKKLFEAGDLSRQDFDERQEQYTVTELQTAQAQQAFDLSQQQSDIYAAEVKDLKSSLGVAQYQLQISQLYAPTDGYVNNLKIFRGGYVNSGDTLFGFINRDTTRIVANIKDTNLAMLHPGKRVWVYLANYPWRFFKGEVESLGRGVSRSESTEDPALPYIEPVTSWIRYSYRIPVRINLVNFPEDKQLFVGADARVFVFR